MSHGAGVILIENMWKCGRQQNGGNEKIEHDEYKNKNTNDFRTFQRDEVKQLK